MVKLKGPAASLQATGTVAETMTFSKWKATQYLRFRKKPANPKTGIQTSMRSMWAWLSKYWQSLTAAEQATWDTLASQKNISPFNAYLKENQQRWRAQLGTTKSYPANPVSSFATWLTYPTPTAGRESVTIRWKVNSPGQNWGIVFYGHTAPFSPGTHQEVITVQTAEISGLDSSWVWQPLTPGTYYFRFRQITKNGAISTAAGMAPATVP